MGIAMFVLCGVIALVGAGVAFASPSFESVLFELAFVALAAFGLVMAVKPPALLATRATMVARWFAAHGAAAPADGTIKTLHADYAVSVEPLGFVEQSSAGRIATPWFALRPAGVRRARGVYFPVDDGKESSLAYNMLGVNWALRDESAMHVLFVPNEVLRSVPGVEAYIADSIRRSRAAFRGRQQSPSDAAALKLWLGNNQ